MKKSNKGFSLIELLIVIVIMGILSVVGSTVYGGYKENAKAFAIRQVVYGIDKEIKSLAETHGLSKSATASGLVEVGNSYIDVVRYGVDFVLDARQTSYDNAPHTNMTAISVSVAPTEGTAGVYNIEGMPLAIIAGNATHNAYSVTDVDTGILSNYIDKYHKEITLDTSTARAEGTDVDYTAANADGQHDLTIFIKR